LKIREIDRKGAKDAGVRGIFLPLVPLAPLRSLKSRSFQAVSTCSAL
jgi:hypothetical protein